MIIIGLILLLNVLDIYNTLYIISMGGVEANPFMKYFLDINVWVFIGVKMGIVTLGLLTLVKYCVNLYIILNIILTIYLTLIVYQCYIIFILIGV
jgi:hypothetical protein